MWLAICFVHRISNSVFPKCVGNLFFKHKIQNFCHNKHEYESLCKFYLALDWPYLQVNLDNFFIQENCSFHYLVCFLCFLISSFLKSELLIFNTLIIKYCFLKLTSIPYRFSLFKLYFLFAFLVLCFLFFVL